MPSRNPIDQVIDLQGQGKDDADIVATLTNQGLDPEQISNAINQAKIKSAVSSKSSAPSKSMESSKSSESSNYPVGEKPTLSPSANNPGNMSPSIMARAPSPTKELTPPTYSPDEPMSMQPQEQFYDYASSGVDTEAIEEIAEEIIGEKWDEAKSKISGIVEWKDYTNNRLASFEGKMKRVESLIDNLQTALLGKVQRYEQNIKDLGTEMKSIQGAFSKVLSPLSANVKELQHLTGKLNKSKKSSKKHITKKRRKK